MVAQGIPQPLHIGPLAAQVNEIRRRFRDATEPGDAFIVNHPYQACQNHATDVTVISPMFVRRAAGRLHRQHRAQARPRRQGPRHQQRRRHRPVPGRPADSADSRSCAAARSTATCEALICANTRTPEVTWGDIKAQVNTNTYGLTKFAELFGKHGVDTVLACWQRWMDICETELRKEIAKVPDGRYGPETDYLDDDGVELAKPHRISASLRGQGRHAALHPRQRRAGAWPDQPATLRLAQLHRMPGEDDLHSGPAGERRPVAAGARVLSAGRLAAQSALSRAGEHVRAPEPGHDLGHHAGAGAGRCPAGCRRRAAPPAARYRARDVIRSRGAGIRSTRS